MSECDRIEEYLDEEMTAAGRDAMARHVESCSDCSRAVSEHRRLRRLALDVAPVEVPDGLGDLIRQRLATTGPAGGRRPARIFRPFAFAGAAAVAAAAILVFVFVPIVRVPPPPVLTPQAVTDARPPTPDLDATVSDWLVQAGNAAEGDVDRLRAEAREQRLLAKVRAAIPAVRGTADGEYLTAVSDLLVQLDNGPGPGFLSEEARLVARYHPRPR